jgi:uncharacterized protein
MQLTFHPSTAAYHIRSYSPGRVVINEQTFTASLVLTPDLILPNWPPQRFGDLLAEHFETVAGLGPELVILGSGSRLCFPEPEQIAPLIHQRIGLEVMDTGAACRTFAVLASEGRRVAAALLLT